MTIDPHLFATKPGEFEAARYADLERRLRAQERGQPPQGEWQTPTLLTGFANTEFGFAPAGYYKDVNGRVLMRGVVTSVNDSPIDEPVFELLEGFRPAYVHKFAVVSGSTDGDIPIWASVTVRPDGVASVTGGGIETFPLDVVQFRTT